MPTRIRRKAPSKTITKNLSLPFTAERRKQIVEHLDASIRALGGAGYLAPADRLEMWGILNDLRSLLTPKATRRK